MTNSKFLNKDLHMYWHIPDFPQRSSWEYVVIGNTVWQYYPFNSILMSYKRKHSQWLFLHLSPENCQKINSQLKALMKEHASRNIACSFLYLCLSRISEKVLNIPEWYLLMWLKVKKHIVATKCDNILIILTFFFLKGCPEKSKKITKTHFIVIYIWQHL